MQTKTNRSRNPIGPATTSRRDFLVSSGALVAGAAFHAVSYGRIRGANDRIRIGVIGCGGMGMGHIDQFVKEDKSFATLVNAEITAACDIYEPRKKQAAESSGAKVFHDYGELLGSGLVDAVIIASPEHWHHRMALDAVAAKVDIYLQKPMTRTFSEAKSLYEAVRKSECVFQLGSQYMQTPTWKRAKELYQQGHLGKITFCQTSYCRNSKEGEWNYTIDEGVQPGKNLDWKAFLGPLPYMEYNPEFFFRWRKYKAFSGGIITDLLPHKIHTLAYVMGMKFPRRVAAVGGIYVHPDRDVADTVLVTVEFEDYTMAVAGSTCNESGLEDLIRGHHGNLYVGGNTVRMVPERTYAEEYDAIEERVEPAAMDSHELHIKEWIEAMRDRSKKPTWAIDPAFQVMTTIAMAEEAYLKKRVVEFDAATLRVS